MKVRLLFGALLAVVAVLMASAAFAAPTASEAVPFKGSVQATETYAIAPPIMHVDANGSGQATQLGLYSVQYEADVNLVNLSALVTLHIVAANGDSLDADGVGQADTTEIPNVFLITEEYTITGGTGRFAGATGSFTVGRVVSTATGITSGSFDGNIVLR